MQRPTFRILDNLMPMLSPSQVETARCPRRWYYKYVEKHPEPKKQAALDGSAIDKIVELAIKQRKLPSSEGWGPVALAALQYLAKNLAGTSKIPQVMLSAIPFGGALFGGFDSDRPVAIDVLDELRIEEPHRRDARGNPVPLVMDLKTTGDKKWVKSKDVLEKDLQLLVYVRAASIRFLITYGYEPPEVDARWCYVIRNVDKPRVFPVEMTLTQKMIDDGEKAWQQRIVEVLDLALARDAGTLTPEGAPKNTQCCYDYGGCAFGYKFLNVCDLDPMEMVPGMSNTLSQADIQAMLAQNGLMPNTQPAQAAPAQTLMNAQPGLPDLQNPQQLVAAQQAQMQAFIAQQQAQAQQAQAQALAQQHAAAAQAPQAQAAPQYTPEQIQAFLAQQQAHQAQAQVQYTPPALQPAPAAAPTPAAAPPAGKKRGRKSNAERAAIAAANAAAGITTPAESDDGPSEEEARAAWNTVFDFIASRLGD